MIKEDSETAEFCKYFQSLLQVWDLLFGFLILFDLFSWFVGLGCFFGVCVWVFFPLGWLGFFFIGGVVQCCWTKILFFSQDLIFAVSETVLSEGEREFTGYES